MTTWQDKAVLFAGRLSKTRQHPHINTWAVFLSLEPLCILHGLGRKIHLEECMNIHTSLKWRNTEGLASHFPSCIRTHIEKQSEVN